MKKLIPLILIFSLLFLLQCKKSSSNDSYGICVIEGSVTLDGQPYAGVYVEYGFAYVRGSTIGTDLTWSSQILTTDADGNYTFSREQLNDRYDYHVRAMHPIDGYWRDYMRGTIMGHQTITHNFAFTTQ